MRPIFANGGRGVLLLLLSAAAALLAEGSPAQAATMVGQSEASRCGLRRAWYAQAGSLRSTGPINHVRYSDGLLLVQTSEGMLSAIDAETGRKLWSTQVGPRGRQSSEAAANQQNVAVVNGSHLYILDRLTGHILRQSELGDAPGAGPAVSATHAFVPLVNGTIEGYQLDGVSKIGPWKYKGAGRVLVSPMTTGQSMSWTTEKGFFYVAVPDAGDIKFRLETRGAIHARPGYWTPNLFAGSTDGMVYAVDERTGKINWKVSVGDPIYEPPVPVENRVFIVSETQGLTCLDSGNGKELWHVPAITQVLSVSPTRLYVTDNVQRLVVLDVTSGVRQASMPLGDATMALTNNFTDRIYLASNVGVVQCLREIGAKNPVLHVPPAPTAPESRAKLKERVPKATDEAAPPSSTEEPAGDEPAMDDLPAADADAPEMPAETDTEDPFK